MRRFLKFRVIGFAIAAVLIAAITVISVNTAGNSGFISNTLTALSKPLKGVASSVAKTFESIYGYMYEYEQVVKQNEELNMELSELQEKYREYTEISEENDRLRELLNLSKRHEDFQYDTASIIGWDSSNWSSTFTISKGSANSDVAVGDCVITETGVLIGCITDVGTTSSNVVTVLDTTFSAGAIIERNGNTAIAGGDFELMQKDLMKLDFLSEGSEILAGDTIVTSGKGRLLPAGLVIGEVVDVLTYETGISRYATMRPAADLENIVYVYVITGFEITE
jgi:rod shape-determining protein MreC